MIYDHCKPWPDCDDYNDNKAVIMILMTYKRKCFFRVFAQLKWFHPRFYLSIISLLWHLYLLTTRFAIS